MKVYKFRSIDDKKVLKRDINSFKANQFYAPNFKNLNDKFEANFDEVITTAINSIKEKSNVDSRELSKKLDELISHKEKLGIFCLSKNCYSETMWAYYSNDNRGYCIEYDLDKLKDKWKNRDFSRKLKVKYRNKKPVISVLDIDSKKLIQKMFATKKKRWQHEEEIRLIFDNIGLKEHHESAITGIYFGCDALDETIKKIKSEFENRDIAFYKIVANTKTHKLERKLIDQHIKNLKYKLENFNYELVKTVDNTANSYYLFVEENYTLQELQELAKAFKEKYCYKPSNIYFINSMEILSLIDVYPKNDQEYTKFADAVIADFIYSDNPEICEYPFRDFRYFQNTNK